jgi:hypothetical protein
MEFGLVLSFTDVSEKHLLDACLTNSMTAQDSLGREKQRAYIVPKLGTHIPYYASSHSRTMYFFIHGDFFQA